MKNINNHIETITFSSFDEAEVGRFFGIKAESDCKPHLKEWNAKAAQVKISDFEQQQLIPKFRDHKKLSQYIRSWNETELREKFIAHVLELVDYDDFELGVTSFAERTLEIVINNRLLTGKIDWMVSSGQFGPERPFFFLHEFKKEKNSRNDPVGQLLSAMYIAKLINQEKGKPNLFNEYPKSYGDVPLYGLYIIGRLWFFVRLMDKSYCISKSYDSSDKNALDEIFKLLKAQKNMIFELVRSEQDK